MKKQYPLTAAQRLHDDWIKKYKNTAGIGRQRCGVVKKQNWISAY